MEDQNSQTQGPQNVTSKLVSEHDGKHEFPAGGRASRLASVSGNITNYYFPVEVEIIGASRSAADGNITNYYFPIEVEIIGTGRSDAVVEQIYAALKQELDAG